MNLRQLFNFSLNGFGFSADRLHMLIELYMTDKRYLNALQVPVCIYFSITNTLPMFKIRIHIPVWDYGGPPVNNGTDWLTLKLIDNYSKFVINSMLQSSSPFLLMWNFLLIYFCFLKDKKNKMVTISNQSGNVWDPLNWEECRGKLCLLGNKLIICNNNTVIII